MNKYTYVLKEIANNFSYQQFIELLKQLDNEIVNGSINNFDPEFIHYFKQITNMVNDQYLVDNNEYGTLGHMLVENALLEKQKITPTLAICFYLEQKHNLGLDNVCNNITFSGSSNDNYIMYVEDKNNGLININWSHYANFKGNPDEFNYDMMKKILHELTHVYQFTRTCETENIFDKLVYYDYQQLKNLQRGECYSKFYEVHQSMISEFMADEQAYAYMLHIAKNHPEYFNDELIQQQQTIYKKRKNGTYDKYGSDPRFLENKHIIETKNLYQDFIENVKDKNALYVKDLDFIPIMLAKADEIDKKRIPLIAQLQMQGISEKGWDSYYSIYLKSIYQFDGESIILANVSQNKVSKGI